MRLPIPSLGIFLLCGLLFVGDHRTAAQAPTQFVNVEYQIKAGYFAYFGRYVRWPAPTTNNAFVIGILGNNPFGQNLQAVGNGFRIRAGGFEADKIQGKKIAVVQYKSVGEFDQKYRPCQILFICRTSAPGVQGETVEARVQAALKKTKGTPVLIVAEANTMSDSKKLARLGAMVSYWNDQRINKVKMIVNRNAEKRERLSISSRLLSLSIVTVL